MINALTYQEYVEIFNHKCTDFRHTNRGPIAKADGVWHYVNGRQGDIMDVRCPLTDRELEEFGVTNESYR